MRGILMPPHITSPLTPTPTPFPSRIRTVPLTPTLRAHIGRTQIGKISPSLALGETPPAIALSGKVVVGLTVVVFVPAEPAGEGCEGVEEAVAEGLVVVGVWVG